MREDFYLKLYYKVKPIWIKNLIYKRLMKIVYDKYGHRIKNYLEWCWMSERDFKGVWIIWKENS